MIYLFLANGFEECEALCPLDLMRRAKIEVTTVGVGGKYIEGAHGITVCADITDAELCDDAPDGVILPGGMPGTLNLDACAAVHKALDAPEKRGALICAICAAPSVLGKRGYLRGKQAVCFPSFEEYLDGAILQPKGIKVVTDGKIITAVGMGAAVEFGLALVRVLKGDEAANALCSAILAD